MPAQLFSTCMVGHNNLKIKTKSTAVQTVAVSLDTETKKGKSNDTQLLFEVDVSTQSDSNVTECNSMKVDT